MYRKETQPNSRRRPSRRRRFPWKAAAAAAVAVVVVLLAVVGIYRMILGRDPEGHRLTPGDGQTIVFDQENALTLEEILALPQVSFLKEECGVDFSGASEGDVQTVKDPTTGRVFLRVNWGDGQYLDCLEDGTLLELKNKAQSTQSEAFLNAIQSSAEATPIRETIEQHLGLAEGGYVLVEEKEEGSYWSMRWEQDLPLAGIRNSNNTVTVLLNQTNGRVAQLTRTYYPVEDTEPRIDDEKARKRARSYLRFPKTVGADATLVTVVPWGTDEETGEAWVMDRAYLAYEVDFGDQVIYVSALSGKVLCQTETEGEEPLTVGES